MPQGRTLLVAVDDSPTSQNAALFAANNLARPSDALHLIAIAPPPSYAMTPAAPIASAGAVAALSINWEQQRKAEEEQCRHMLHKVVHQLPQSRREELNIHRHVLPAGGGASGVAESVVAFAKEHSADLVVVGSRGMGAVKSTLMSLVGLGSVSGYLVHHLHCPVVICRGREEDAQQQTKRKIMVSLDDSEASRKALEWALDNAVGQDDELHLVCVALPIPYPVVAEDAAASEVLEADEFDAATQDSIHYAREIVTKAVDSAAAKVAKDRIFFKALAPEGGASDVGQSIVHYAKENGVGLDVLGARGMGSWKRAIMSFVGLGSVSDYVVHHTDSPVVVIKQH
ncbi:universal stress [Micractinium conductrix]|uniref:Universal stress n=1 Tax=Micractinium conductrix TaxID=554055 RepID=A0A2P6VEA2_9CHLO|nr:universal stress [Micractinium conductrix]|eukprot:PSC72425.1 universal stress [Micractinium conductrix]